MAKTDVLDILRAKKMDPMEFHFENLWIPPMNFYLTPQDVEELRKIATSVRLSSKIQQKYDMIDRIMRARGFKRFSAGTNRVVYKCLEDTRFLVKIAVDKVGMQDNPLEYKNQFLLQPFVTKMFYVSPCGTVGFSERVLPIKNKEEFKQIASDVFDILVNKILGVYVVEDVGTKYFMNWGIRLGFGPVLLDYPYVYKLDGDKLFCTRINPETGMVCDGEIDYDSGFNHLICTRCNKVYLATNLRDDSIDNKIVIRKGGTQMRVIIKKGDKIISEPIPVDEVMKRSPVSKKSSSLVVGINRGSNIEIICNDDSNIESVNDHNNEEIVQHDIESDTYNKDDLNNDPISVDNDNTVVDNEDDSCDHIPADNETDDSDESCVDENNDIEDDKDSDDKYDLNNTTVVSNQYNYISTGKGKNHKNSGIKSSFIPSKPYSDND